LSKKTVYKKRRLGKKLKQNRRMPLLARMRTHRKLESNTYARNWRRLKMRIKDE
jgi:ribosomal protein L39E